MGALFGALSSLSVGMSEMFGRRGARATGVLAVSVVSQGVAALAAFGMLLWLPSQPTWPDLGRGAVSGVGFGVGMVAYLGGLMRSSATVIAPMVATVTVVIPFGAAVAGGAEMTLLAALGVGVALVGLLFITTGGSVGSGMRAGLLWGAISGLGYGVGLAALIGTSSDSGSWPAVAQRVVACLLTVVAAMVVRSPVMPRGAVRWVALWSGVFGGIASVLYLLGIQADVLPAAVTGAMFPAVSVAIGRFVFGDRVRPVQVLGLGLVLTGVAGVVAG
ncbi:MAG: DMT family transporter [Acidimicrobiales bacterium]|nr:DMT family transporter [Acidimicrobiales bacterium]|tara:strand:+ start:818 stop:1642 length:825 start_codon:yes stop_codon:yes gene_type:complete